MRGPNRSRPGDGKDVENAQAENRRERAQSEDGTRYSRDRENTENEAVQVPSRIRDAPQAHVPSIGRKPLASAFSYAPSSIGCLGGSRSSATRCRDDRAARLLSSPASSLVRGNVENPPCRPTLDFEPPKWLSARKFVRLGTRGGGRLRPSEGLPPMRWTRQGGCDETSYGKRLPPR